MPIRTYAQQKAGLTRAITRATNNPFSSLSTIIDECRKTLAEWASPEWKAQHGTNAWPDDWARWQRALDDAARYPQRAPRLEDLES